MSLGSGRVIGFPYAAIEETAERLVDVVSIDELREQRAWLVSNIQTELRSLPELINSGLAGLEGEDREEVARRISVLVAQLQLDLERLHSLKALEVSTL